MPASAAAACTASAAESRRSPVRAVSRASDDDTYATLPSTTPTAIRPSCPAARPSKRWRMSTARPGPTGAALTSSSSLVSVSDSPSSPRF